MDILCRECWIDRKADADSTDWSEYPGEYMKFATGRGSRDYLCDKCNASLPSGSMVCVVQSCPEDYYDTEEEKYLEKPYRLHFVPFVPARAPAEVRANQPGRKGGEAEATRPGKKPPSLGSKIRRLLAFE
jgi:hypothetical protein